jgi:adenylate kinase
VKKRQPDGFAGSGSSRPPGATPPGGEGGHYKLVIIGPPGSGKGTHARGLAKRLSVPHISTGALLRREIEAHTPLGRQVADAVRSGMLVADEDIVEIVERQVPSDSAAEGWILDGAPRTLGQAELLAPLIEGEDPAIVIALDVDDDELRRRLGRRRTDERRADDDPNVVEERLALWTETGPRLVDRYARRGLLIRVDGTGTICDTSSRVWADVEPAISVRSSTQAEP